MLLDNLDKKCDNYISLPYISVSIGVNNSDSTKIKIHILHDTVSLMQIGQHVSDIKITYCIYSDRTQPVFPSPYALFVMGSSITKEERRTVVGKL